MLADIYWAVEAKHELAAAQLLLSGIDAVAGLEDLLTKRIRRVRSSWPGQPLPAT